MADPVSAMAIASMGASIVGGGVKAFGAYQGGQATQAMDNYRARVAQINAGIAQEQANTELVAGDIRAQVSGLRTGERMAMTRAGIGAGNLSLGSGSARQVLSSEAEVGQFEQASIRNDAARRAYGKNVEAFSDLSQVSIDTAAGHEARTAAGFDVASSILGGATQVSDKWAKFGETGVTPQPFGYDNSQYSV